MRIDTLVDERRDPIAATRGAAQYLSRLHDILDSWPLAITAYNHGPEGIARGVSSTGSSDIVTLIREYDGRAFGFITYPPKEDGTQYNEGYVFQDGKMHPAGVVQAPWLRRIVGAGDDVTCELESELGRHRIEGVTTLSTFRMANPDLPGLNLQQSGVRYTWDGQSAYGMIEH